MGLQLVIGNKNYSSWSMRPWVLMRQLGIGFDEIKLRLGFAEGSPFHRAIARYSPAGRVPVLVDDGFAVWDTLAITEYLHERFPAAGVWPQAPQTRARARSLCAEMHSGFPSLRSHCPMNIEADLAEAGARVWDTQPAVRGDLARIERIFAEQLRAGDGPFLFGAFGAADAFFAPVCMRIRSYALPVSPETSAYAARVAEAPGVARWIEGALAEHDFLADDEPYRQPPPGRAG